jgi:hypothetical protein
VRGLGAGFLLRRARSSWLLLACVAVTVLLTTGLAAVLWGVSDASIPFGAQSALAAPQGRVLGLTGVTDAGEAAADTGLIRAALRRAWPGVGFQLNSAVWANPLHLPQPPGSTVIAQIQLGSLEGIAGEATLTAGHWPPPPGHGGPVPVALPDAVATALHLRVGSVLTGNTPAGIPTPLRVTGLFRARNPASPYWALDLLPVSGISARPYSIGGPGNLGPVRGTQIGYGPAVVNPAAFGSAGALAVGQGSWMVLPQAPVLARGNIQTLAAGTSAAISQLSVVLPEGLQISSDLPQLLAGIAGTTVLDRSLFTIALLEMLLVAGAGLVLAARLLASGREEESALLRARGATRWQLARPVLAEAAVTGAAAALAGVLAGARLTGAAARAIGLRLAGPPNVTAGVSALAWWSGLAVLVLCVAVLTWPALFTVSPGAARQRGARQARLARIAGAGGDLALVVLAAVAVWQLRGFSAVAHPGSGSFGIDPVVAIAPALALAGMALIPLRGLPLLARLADQATDHERRLAAAMVSWQIARRPVRQAGPVLLVVVATATTTLALAGYASWRQSTADQAAFAVGSDVQVNAAVPLALGATGTITRAPGVTAATAASQAGIGNGSQLIALDASTAGRTILLRPDLSPLPLRALWGRITPPVPSGLSLPGRPVRLEILATLGAGPQTTPAELRTELGPVGVTAWISDAGGAIYQVSAAGILPADGRPHPVAFTLSASRQASYPLRLVGLTLAYLLPPFDPANPASSPTAALRISALAVAAAASGPFGRPFPPGAALATWPGTGLSMFVPAGPPSPGGGIPPQDGIPPGTLGWQGLQFIFTAGHRPNAANSQFLNGPPVGQVQLTVPSPGVVPVIATSGYLAASGLRVGSTLPVTISGFPVQARIVASVARFPTVYGANQALIADLAEVNDVLIASGAQPLPVTRWWLRTAGSRVPPLPAGLDLSITDQASQQAALLGNPLLKAPRQAMLAIGVAVVLLGVLGFSVSVAASLRARRTQSAVFAALGVGKNAQAGQLCLEQCALSLPAAAAGLLAGAGLAELTVPAITLTLGGTEPVPPALVILPLVPAVALALVTAAGPVAAAALSILRRPDPAARLRAETG